MGFPVMTWQAEHLESFVCSVVETLVGQDWWALMEVQLRWRRLVHTASNGKRCPAAREKLVASMAWRHQHAAGTVQKARDWLYQKRQAHSRVSLSCLSVADCHVRAAEVGSVAKPL